jgi:formylglycine-generating enzyme required for sulfatase activity
MRKAFVLVVALILGIEATFTPGSGAADRGQAPESKPTASAVTTSESADFQSRLLAATAKHLDLLIDSETNVAMLKGKGADGMTALAYDQIYERTGNRKYRTAAAALADRIVKDMKATKHGVLYIKEKDAGGGESIAGGGPPAFGWCTSSAAYIFHKEGGRTEDVKYVASVIDNFPWNANGWWANAIDTRPGRPKQPLTKPGAISKNAAMAMCAGRLLAYCDVKEQASEKPPTTISPPMVITARRGSLPALLVAPFTFEEARKRQAAWAQHLGTDIQVRNSIGMKLTLIPSGEFQMGSHESMEETAAFAIRIGYKDARAESYRDEHPRHQVQLSKPFFLGTHEVTRGEFRKFVDDSGYQSDAESDGQGGLGYNASQQKLEQKREYTWKNPGWDQTDEHPVVNVTWNDAAKFCEWLSRREGETYRLPTEAQWEYACRAGTTGRVVTGNVPEELEGFANVGDQSYHRIPGFQQSFGFFAFDDGASFTSTVGKYRKNPFGLTDMHGNVWEWCNDWYDAGYYENSPRVDPSGPPAGLYRVYRGGGWLNDPVGCRSARRAGPSPSSRCNRLGFRLVRAVSIGSNE